MEDKDKLIRDLFLRLEQLRRQQNLFADEIQSIHNELSTLQSAERKQGTIQDLVQAATRKEEPTSQDAPRPEPSVRAPTKGARAPMARTAWEDFIGKNLLNKIGILVLILGIGFGVKYSIDRDLISPITRIFLGYFAGVSLLAIAYRLKSTHISFSAVLLSGGMAVLYFVTLLAYTLYGLIPQLPAFVLMVAFTAFTVFAAMRYNLEVVGIIGLVGAYAVPVLLSDGSGSVAILFSYIAIINGGILTLAFKKYWKRLYYLAFFLTWLAFGSWYAVSFDKDEHITESLVFSTLFFLIFYATFLAYKIVRNEALSKGEVICMLFNSFVSFGYGYLTIEAIPGGEQYLGLFAVFTAVLHFIAVLVLSKSRTEFRAVFYLVAGMGIVFLTIAVPVQFEGNWVTLVWTAESVLLMWIGKTRSALTYEKLSYPLMMLAFLSLLHDWSAYHTGASSDHYQHTSDLTIFLNIHFFTSMLVGVAFVYILWLRNHYSHTTPERRVSPLDSILNIVLPVVTVIIFYVGFFKEVEAFWNHRYAVSRIVIRDANGLEYDQYNTDLLHFKQVWLLIYSSVFAAALSIVARRWRTNLALPASLAVNATILLAFITAGLLNIGELRAGFLEQDLAAYYPQGASNIIIRYAAILSVLPLLWLNRRIVRDTFFNEHVRKFENLSFHLVVLAILSSELIHWLEMTKVENSFKLSLSILWGAYALFLIILGVSRDLKHVRLAAIVLFAVTLLKLFAYDMEEMSTILKTLVTIVLGVLLLMASFIYNKYRGSGNEAPR